MTGNSTPAEPLGLRWRFSRALLVIGAIALVPVALGERASAEMSADAHLINIAGRQRMLSQRVVKLTHQATDARLTTAERRTAALQLDVSLGEWNKAARELEAEALDAEGEGALAEAQHALTAITASSAAALHSAASPADTTGVSSALRRLRQADDVFVPAMERAVHAFEARAEAHDRRVTVVRRAGLLLLLLSFGLTWIFILAPAAELVRRALRELQETNASLDTALVEAHAATRLKGEFLATMSHELRTPLNAVIGLSGLLAETKLDERQRRFTDTIGASGEALLHVINDILDFSKIEAGKLELEAVEFDVRELVESTVETMALRAEDKGLELATVIEPEVPESVRGDAGRVRQVLTNFLGNALKFTERGNVVVQVSAPASGVLRVAVADTGIGIAPAALDRLFAAFTQADASTTRRFGGTGLGLSISRKLVELMGGHVGVSSVEGEGSTFTFELPLPTVAAFESTGSGAAIAPGLRVLVVDDLEANRMVVTNALARWQADVHEAASAADALELVAADRAAGEPFEVVIVDWQMPRMDGIEFAARLRADPARYGSPRLILLSSFGRGESGADEARDAGFDAWLSKPVRLRVLRRAIRRALGVVPSPGAPESTSEAAASEAAATPAQWHARALVADDNPVNTMVLQSMLRRYGLHTDAVADGEEALAALERGTYDLVFLDVHMPVMDGLTAARTLRTSEAHDGRRRTPLIACTASVLASDLEACREAGMDDVIAKPIPLPSLHAMLSRWLGSPTAGS